MARFKDFHFLRLEAGNDGRKSLLSPAEMTRLYLESLNLNKANYSVKGYSLTDRALASIYTNRDHNVDITGALPNMLEESACTMMLGIKSKRMRLGVKTCFCDASRNILDVFNPTIHKTMAPDWYADLSEDRYASFYDVVNEYFIDYVREWSWSDIDIHCAIDGLGTTAGGLRCLDLYGGVDGWVYAYPVIISPIVHERVYSNINLFIDCDGWRDHKLFTKQLSDVIMSSAPVNMFNEVSRLLQDNNQQQSGIQIDNPDMFSAFVGRKLFACYNTPLVFLNRALADIAELCVSLLDVKKVLYRLTSNYPGFSKFFMLRNFERDIVRWHEAYQKTR